MGMYEGINDIREVFRFDETLLRLLYYPPEDLRTSMPDPLDEILPNMLDMDEDWSIRDKHIMLIPKASDFEEEPLCRIYLYAGRRLSSGDYHIAKQQVIVDILCHNDFEVDLRSLRISDRINQLLVHEKMTGIGRMTYEDGDPISAPENYVGYRHIYQFGSLKK
ncbi:hypothetical protein V1503_18870 [Bacillus sp. SCS-151]|uniref:hypothetical protein n=1 Tax=Nanhaiella sioensis TaxID=3115293 RepID=UPI00397C5724